MALDQSIPRGIDIRLTEQYLLGMADVLDASVWWSDGALNAHVTIAEDSSLERRHIQAACMTDLGIHQTPRAVKLVMRRRYAA